MSYNNESNSTGSIKAANDIHCEHPDVFNLEERLNKCIAPKFLQIDAKLSDIEGKLTKVSDLEGKLTLILEIIQRQQLIEKC